MSLVEVLWEPPGTTFGCKRPCVQPGCPVRMPPLDSSPVRPVPTPWPRRVPRSWALESGAGGLESTGGHRLSACNGELLRHVCGKALGSFTSPRFGPASHTIPRKLESGKSFCAGPPPKRCSHTRVGCASYSVIAPQRGDKAIWVTMRRVVPVFGVLKEPRDLPRFRQQSGAATLLGSDRLRRR